LKLSDDFTAIKIEYHETRKVNWLLRTWAVPNWFLLSLIYFWSKNVSDGVYPLVIEFYDLVKFMTLSRAFLALLQTISSQEFVPKAEEALILFVILSIFTKNDSMPMGWPIQIPRKEIIHHILISLIKLICLYFTVLKKITEL
jgi:hypothetical protein